MGIEIATVDLPKRPPWKKESRPNPIGPGSLLTETHAHVCEQTSESGETDGDTRNAGQVHVSFRIDTAWPLPFADVTDELCPAHIFVHSF